MLPAWLRAWKNAEAHHLREPPDRAVGPSLRGRAVHSHPWAVFRPRHCAGDPLAMARQGFLGGQSSVAVALVASFGGGAARCDGGMISIPV